MLQPLTSSSAPEPRPALPPISLVTAPSLSPPDRAAPGPPGTPTPTLSSLPGGVHRTAAKAAEEAGHLLTALRSWPQGPPTAPLKPALPLRVQPEALGRPSRPGVGTATLLLRTRANFHQPLCGEEVDQALPGNIGHWLPQASPWGHRGSRGDGERQEATASTQPLPNPAPAAEQTPRDPEEVLGKAGPTARAATGQGPLKPSHHAQFTCTASLGPLQGPWEGGLGGHGPGVKRLPQCTDQAAHPQAAPLEAQGRFVPARPPASTALSTGSPKVGEEAPEAQGGLALATLPRPLGEGPPRPHQLLAPDRLGALARWPPGQRCPAISCSINLDPSGTPQVGLPSSPRPLGEGPSRGRPGEAWRPSLPPYFRPTISSGFISCTGQCLTPWQAPLSQDCPGPPAAPNTVAPSPRLRLRDPRSLAWADSVVPGADWRLSGSREDRSLLFQMSRAAPARGKTDEGEGLAQGPLHPAALSSPSSTACKGPSELPPAPPPTTLPAGPVGGGGLWTDLSSSPGAGLVPRGWHPVGHSLFLPTARNVMQQTAPRPGLDPARVRGSQWPWGQGSQLVSPKPSSSPSTITSPQRAKGKPSSSAGPVCSAPLTPPPGRLPWDQSVPAQARAVKLSLVWSPQERSVSLGQLPPAGSHAAGGPGLRVPAVVGVGWVKHVLKGGRDPPTSFLVFGQSLEIQVGSRPPLLGLPAREAAATCLRPRPLPAACARFPIPRSPHSRLRLELPSFLPACRPRAPGGQRQGQPSGTPQRLTQGLNVGSRGCGGGIGKAPKEEHPGLFWIVRGPRRPGSAVHAVLDRGPRTSAPSPLAAPRRLLPAPCAPPTPLPGRSAHRGLGARSLARISALRASVSLPPAAARTREDPRGAQAGPLAQRGGRGVRGLRHIDLHAGTRDAKGLLGTGWERSGWSPARDSEAGLSALCDRRVGGRGQLAVRSHLATAASRSHPLQRRPQSRPAGQPRTSAQPQGANSSGWAPNDAPPASPTLSTAPAAPLARGSLGVFPVSTRLSSADGGPALGGQRKAQALSRHCRQVPEPPSQDGLETCDKLS
ncbi:nascent polypeptide-associated complex subunit alpha, muscle-specific form-like [Mesoplodon densirostris]|uniref:nascent polypeptide-associated complex subunit alpha, muscle-specific form-like n=1 Tax=Mesoplodon densirostris TaxID=48708 RepID=UPI0028DD2F35|nr:nascent polypeptide-associated complex subunit alpha, muscle-specific form-like [Mesoplodon densirostris]